MRTAPILSICISSYNTAKHLKECIDLPSHLSTNNYYL